MAKYPPLKQLDRDNMAQVAQPVGFFHFGLIPEEKMFGVLRLEHWKTFDNFLANMPFLYYKISTFSNQFTK